MKKALNLILYEARIKKGFTLRQAAKKLHILPHFLGRLEYGYYTVSDKLLARAVEVYGIDEATLENSTQSYAGTIPTSKKQPFFTRILHKKYSKYVIPAISALMALVLVFAAVGFYFSMHKPQVFFGSSYKQFNTYINGHGGILTSHGEERDDDGYTVTDYSISWNRDYSLGYPQFEYREAYPEENYYVYIYSSPVFDFKPGVDVTFTQAAIGSEASNGGFLNDLLGMILGDIIGGDGFFEDFDDIEYDDEEPEALAKDADGEEEYEYDESIPTVQVRAVFDLKGKLQSISSVKIDGVTSQDQDTIQTMTSLMEDVFLASDMVFNDYFDSLDDAPTRFEYFTLINDISSACSKIIKLKIATFICLALSPALLFIFVVLDIRLLFIFLSRRKNSHDGDEEDENIDLFSDGSETQSSPIPTAEAAATNAMTAEGAVENMPPENNVAGAVIKKAGEVALRTPKFYPLYIHEMLLRLIGLIALAFASSTLFISINNIVSGSIGSFLGIEALSPKMTAMLNKLAPYFKASLPAALILLFFAKIDIMTSRSSLWSALTTSLFLAFYIGFLEIIILDRTGFLDSLRFQSVEVLPPNVFLAMSAYTLMAAFMLYTPKFARGNLKRTVIWRCLAVLPVAYLIVGAVVIPRLSVTLFVRIFFYSNNVMSTVFVIIYIALIYVLQCIRHHLYSHTPENVRRGKYFFLLKNIGACIALGIAVLFDYLFSLGEATAYLSSGASWIPLLSLPVIMFYQPRLEPRKGWQDTTFRILYFAAYLSWLILFLVSPLGRLVFRILAKAFRPLIKYLMIM